MASGLEKGAASVSTEECVYSGLEEGVMSSVIHGFGDASETAFCVVVYLVLKVSDDFFPVLLSSKNRVARLIRQSIPGLELLSGVIFNSLTPSREGTQMAFTGSTIPRRDVFFAAANPT